MADGAVGILYTAQVMREMVRQYKSNLFIRGLALQAVALVRERDELGEIEAVFRYVQNNVRYVKDISGIETLSTPVQTLETAQGDCDDQSTLLAALLESIGYETMFKLTGYHGPDFEHVYVAVLAPNHGMIHLDPTESGDLNNEPPNATCAAYVA